MLSSAGKGSALLTVVVFLLRSAFRPVEDYLHSQAQPIFEEDDLVGGCHAVTIEGALHDPPPADHGEALRLAGTLDDCQVALQLGGDLSWSPFPGQICGWNKLGSGSCHAANLIRSDVPW